MKGEFIACCKMSTHFRSQKGCASIAVLYKKRKEKRAHTVYILLLTLKKLNYFQAQRAEMHLLLSGAEDIPVLLKSHPLKLSKAFTEKYLPTHMWADGEIITHVSRHLERKQNL